MNPLDKIDPAYGIPAALIVWAVYGGIRLRERKLRRDAEREAQR